MIIHILTKICSSSSILIWQFIDMTMMYCGESFTPLPPSLKLNNFRKPEITHQQDVVNFGC